ncbi:MAG: hypothetical protein IJZ23_12355 [Roseburia sp.]|nr:hypothetical protein [Roseburia sp.]
MKNMIMMIISLVIGVLTLMIIMTTEGRSSHSMELHNNLPSVMEEAMNNMAISKDYTIEETNELLADTLEHLIFTLDAPCDLRVDVLSCDKELGILSLRTTAAFLHPNGNPGQVSCERTVILDTVPEENLQSFTITFYIGNELYKQYTILANDSITAPVPPEAPVGMVFHGWKTNSGSAAVFNQPVTQNLTYYADMRTQ